MVAYSFQPRFVAPIEAGTKLQTIRAVGKRRHARPGDELQLYSGMRTSSCRLIRRAVCSSVHDIRIELNGEGGRGVIRVPPLVVYGGRENLDRFATRDGFADWDDMRAFWGVHHPGIHVFEGLLIRWEPAA